MSSPALKIHCTPQEYLALERRSNVKHEFEDGKLYAMAGASRNHGLVAMNLGREISTALRNRPCEAFMSDMRVWVNETGLYTYPDLVVACDEPVYQDNQADTLLNPSLIAEILSPSTESYDRGRKFAHYRRLASLREYVLVAQDRVFVEHWRLQGEEWTRSELKRREDLLHLESIGCVIALETIYEKVVIAAFADSKREEP